MAIKVSLPLIFLMRENVENTIAKSIKAIVAISVTFKNLAFVVTALLNSARVSFCSVY